MTQRNERTAFPRRNNDTAVQIRYMCITPTGNCSVPSLRATEAHVRVSLWISILVFISLPDTIVLYMHAYSSSVAVVCIFNMHRCSIFERITSVLQQYY